MEETERREFRSRNKAEPSDLAVDTHKHDVRNVWLKSTVARESGVLAATFEVPEHTAGVRFADLIEVQRQAGIAHVHQCLEIPHGTVFVLNEIELAATDEAGLGNEPAASGAISVCAHEVKRSGRIVREARQRFEIELEGGNRLVGASRATFLPRPIYERIRKTGDAIKDTGSIGNTIEGALTGTLSEFELTFDSSDPLLRDHQSDHVSAMALICAIESEVQTGHRIRSLSARFLAYADANISSTVFLAIEQSEFHGHLMQLASIRTQFRGRVQAI